MREPVGQNLSPKPPPPRGGGGGGTLVPEGDKFKRTRRV